MSGWELVVYGKPRTKKNSSVIVRGRSILLPSPQFRIWQKKARIEVRHGDQWAPWFWRRAKEIKGLPEHLQPKDPPALVPADVLLNCRATIYRDARRGDAVGYYQGVADLLQHRGVLENDVQLVSWDGTRLAIDRVLPRVHVVLEAIDLPLEEPGDTEVAFP